ncbi:MAG TPA: MMPL family transporter, partial [Acidimicrobiales bacterium]|nr:MMPL family transporter [Acidimicrobiales bacterium]
MLDRWTRAVVRWRVAVVVAWLGVAVVGLLAAGQLSHRLTSSLEVPGTSSAAADAVLARHFHESVEGGYTVVVPGAAAATAGTDVRKLGAAATRFGARVVEVRRLGGLLYANLSTTRSLAGAAAATPALRADLRGVGLDRALVTGPAALQHDLTPILQGDLRRGEVVAVVAAAVILAMVLGLSGALVVPLFVALSTVAGALGLVDLVARRVTLVLYTPNVIALVGLGLAVDYSLLLVHRYRAELSTGAGDGAGEDAITRTLLTAGRTAAWSA